MEVVQQKEGIEQRDFIVAEGAFQMNARALQRGLAFPDFADPACGFHKFLRSVISD